MDVGLSYVEYKRRLADVAAQVDRFLARNPDDLAPPSRACIRLVLDYYKAAGMFWDFEVEIRDLGGTPTFTRAHDPKVFSFVDRLLPLLKGRDVLTSGEIKQASWLVADQMIAKGDAAVASVR